MRAIALTAAALLLTAACSRETATTDEAAAPDPAATAATDTDAEVASAVSAATTSAEITASDLSARIAELADDKYQGRAPASDGGRAAGQWIADEMARVGLEPGGDDGSYFQAVPLVKSTLDGDASSLTIAGAAGPVDLAVGTDTVYWTKRLEPEQSFEDSELVFVGYGSVAPEYGWDDYAGLDVAGKTVVMLVNDPGYATQDSDLFNGRSMTYYGRWTYKFEEAGRQGAAGAIVIHETEPASYPWDVVEGSWTGDQFDLVRPDAGASRTTLEGWISSATAERLFRAAGLDFAAMKQAAQTPGFTPTPMGDLTADATLVTAFDELDSRNVVGVVRGAERPDEYVLYTAHWDHLGSRPAADGEDGIFNGAVDNATGVAAILDIAEAFAAAPQAPARSVMFLAVTAEESGLLGSEYFGAEPLVPLKQIVGGINIDALLPIGRTKDLVVVGYGSSQLEDILAEKAELRGIEIKPDPNPEAGYFYRSDHVSLAKRGVPMLYSDPGEDHVDFGVEYGKAKSQEYRDVAYHKPADEYDANTWEMSGIVESAEIFHDVGADLANSADWPNWYDGNEFRALRDAQRSAD